MPFRIMSTLTATMFLASATVLSVKSANAAPVQADAVPASMAAASEHCSELAGKTFGGGTVESVEWVTTGQTLFKHPLGEIKATVSSCRVRAYVSSVPGSRVTVEVWLPHTWNEKLLGMGGGGYSGGLDAAAIVSGPAVAKGYAAVATDAGHKTSVGAAWAQDQPEKVVDWGHRANHVGAQFAKALVATHYGRPVRRAYFQGCSNGGRDALMEARRYPEDYDGIVAGAPAADWTGMTSSFIWNWQALFNAPDAAKLPSKIKTVSAAIRAKCDLLDGVKEGVLENPHACPFEPAELQCKGADEPTCLTAPEVNALREIYAGPRLKSGQRVFAGFPIGDEDIPQNEQGWLDRGPAGTGAFGVEFFRWMVHKDPAWKIEDFVLDRDYPLAVERMGAIVDSNDPDLKGFIGRGGKLILYHGWSDARIQADATLHYYDAVRRKIGAPAMQRHVRLFMVPGMAHCAGGPGPNSFDMLAELDRWVEGGQAPERVIATKYDNDTNAFLGRPAQAVRTRPLCPWPMTAHYKGAGSTDDAENFVCRESE